MESKVKDCIGCIHCYSKRRSFRNVRMCRRYGVLAAVRCIDYIPRERLKREEARESND